MILLERKANENARAYAYRFLLHNIISLELKPNDIINEKEIASSLNISRTPIREALIELVKNGLVHIIPQKGSYISKIDYKIIEESRFLRLAVELEILKMVCVNIPDIYIAKLHSNILQQELSINLDDISTFINLDNEFHKFLFESVDKQWSYYIISSQMAYFDRYRFLIVKALKTQKIVSEHKEILEAVSNHDYHTAEDVMKIHLGKNEIEKESILQLHPDFFITE